MSVNITVASICDPFFEGVLGGDQTIGQPLTTLLENYDPSKLSQPLEQMFERRPFPSEFEMRQSAGNQNDIARPISEDTIGEMNIPTLRVFDWGFHCSFQSLTPR
jgi:hypothetical protein